MFYFIRKVFKPTKTPIKLKYNPTQTTEQMHGNTFNYILALCTVFYQDIFRIIQEHGNFQNTFAK